MKVKMYKTHFIVILVLCAVLTGCSVSPSDADAAAQVFIKERVKFYGVTSNKSQVVESYNVVLVEAIERGSFWEMKYRAQGTLDNISKEKNITVCVDRKGSVLKFNAKNEPC